MVVLVAAVLRTLARVVTQPPPATNVAINLTSTTAVWVGVRPSWPADALPGPLVLPRLDALSRLAAIDQLHREERVLRAGWAVYTDWRDGARICTPLLSWPIRLTASAPPISSLRAGPERPVTVNGVIQMEVAGELELTPLVADRELAEQLAERAVFGDLGAPADSDAGRQLQAWIHEVTEAAGLGSPQLMGWERNPLPPVADAVEVEPGLVIYQTRQVDPFNMRNSLLEWSRHPGLDGTVLSGLYGSDEPAEVPTPGTPVTPEPELASPLPLSDAQREVVRASRTEPLTVVSGPPGCGKTHVLAALALDAISRGETVLLATRSRYAAEVLGGMLRRAGGPVPVLFGDSELRRAVAEELAEGLPAPLPRAELDTRRRRMDEATAARRRVERAAALAIAEEEAATRARSAGELLVMHRVTAPALFDPKSDVGTAQRQLGAALRPRVGPLAGWRSRRAARRLRTFVGAEGSTALDDVAAAIAALSDLRSAGRLEASGGTMTAGLRQAHAAADTAVCAATASWVDGCTRTGQARSKRSRLAVAELAAALRAGRATRRASLASITGDDLTAALPLWVGTLGDVDDLLPSAPGLFDLIVIDEASHVDQPLAAPALLRGRRAVIAGDPRQLRQVSFVSTEAMKQALQAENTSSLGAVLDVRRMSLFDVAAAAAPVRWLDEHYRCAPHLIGFAARHFYANRMALLTTHPAIAEQDCIDVNRVDGRRFDSGCNAPEVATAMSLVRQRLAAGVRSVGVLSPLRAQADALESALLEGLTVEEISRAKLRVGTVHSFQGSECDELVVSLALTDADSAGSWHFVNDPHLMAVLTTRARRALHVVTSVSTANGLVGEYLKYADDPPGELTCVPAEDTWTAELAHELRRAGLTVRTGYPLGHWRLDLVVGDGQGAVAVETRPHPDGVAAHLSCWRTLAAAGWRCHDAYPSRFSYDIAGAAVQLVGELTASAARSR